MDTTRRITTPEQVLRNKRERYAQLYKKKVLDFAGEPELQEIKRLRGEIETLEREVYSVEIRS